MSKKSFSGGVHPVEQKEPTRGIPFRPIGVFVKAPGAFLVLLSAALMSVAFMGFAGIAG